MMKMNVIDRFRGEAALECGSITRRFDAIRKAAAAAAALQSGFAAKPFVSIRG